MRHLRRQHVLARFSCSICIRSGERTGHSTRSSRFLLSSYFLAFAVRKFRSASRSTDLVLADDSGIDFCCLPWLLMDCGGFASRGNRHRTGSDGYWMRRTVDGTGHHLQSLVHARPTVLDDGNPIGLAQSVLFARRHHLRFWCTSLAGASALLLLLSP